MATRAAALPHTTTGGSPDTHSSLRVLLVDSSDRGGIATYTARLTEALASHGVDARLAAPSGLARGAPSLPVHRWGPEVEGRGKAHLYRARLAEAPRAAAALARAVAALRPDVVHLQTEVVPRLDPAVIKVMGRRAPVVLTAHDPVPHKEGPMALARQARRWRSADGVIIHGDEPRSLVQSAAPRTPVHVVPVDLRLGSAPIDRALARHRLGLGEEPMALMLGFMRPYKGLDVVAEAWSAVAAVRPGARLAVVGEDYGCASELGRIRGLPATIVREGFVAEADVDAWAAAATVVLLPYRHGAHSGILHRAVEMGTPVVAAPSLSEEVRRCRAGAVVALDPRAWAEALAAALGPRPLAAPPPPTGQATVAGTLRVYQELLEARKRRSCLDPQLVVPAR